MPRLFLIKIIADIAVDGETVAFSEEPQLIRTMQKVGGDIYE